MILPTGSLMQGRMTYFLRVVTGIVFFCRTSYKHSFFLYSYVECLFACGKEFGQDRKPFAYRVFSFKSFKPYLKLTAAVNALVLLFALVGVYFVRKLLYRSHCCCLPANRFGFSCSGCSNGSSTVYCGIRA